MRASFHAVPYMKLGIDALAPAAAPRRGGSATRAGTAALLGDGALSSAALSSSLIWPFVARDGARLRSVGCSRRRRSLGETLSLRDAVALVLARHSGTRSSTTAARICARVVTQNCRCDLDPHLDSRDEDAAHSPPLR